MKTGWEFFVMLPKQSPFSGFAGPDPILRQVPRQRLFSCRILSDRFWGG
jgi:hypothetical protein